MSSIGGGDSAPPAMASVAFAQLQFVLVAVTVVRFRLPLLSLSSLWLFDLFKSQNSQEAKKSQELSKPRKARKPKRIKENLKVLCLKKIL